MAATQTAVSNQTLKQNHIRGGSDRYPKDLETPQFVALSWKGFSFPGALSHISNKQPNPLLLCSELKDLDGYLAKLEKNVQTLKQTLVNMSVSKPTEDEDTQMNFGDDPANKDVGNGLSEGLLEKYQSKLAYSGVWMEQRGLEFVGKRVTPIEDEEMDAHLQKLWSEYGLGANPAELEMALFGKQPIKGGYGKSDGDNPPTHTRTGGMQRQGMNQDPEYIVDERSIAKRRDDMRKYDPRIRGPMRLAEQFSAIQKDCIKLSVFAIGNESYKQITERLEALLDAGTLPEFLPTEETISYQVNELMKNKKNQERIVKIMEALRHTEVKDEDVQAHKEKVGALVGKLHSVIKQVNQTTLSMPYVPATCIKRTKDMGSRGGQPGHKQEDKVSHLKASAQKTGDIHHDVIEITELLPTVEANTDKQVETGEAGVKEDENNAVINVDEDEHSAELREIEAVVEARTAQKAADGAQVPDNEKEA